MNQAVRSTGVGMGLGAYFMAYGFTTKQQSSNFMGFDANAVIKQFVPSVGSPEVAAAIWIVFCLGLGLFIGGILWPQIEKTFQMFFEHKTSSRQPLKKIHADA